MAKIVLITDESTEMSEKIDFAPRRKTLSDKILRAKLQKFLVCNY
jgi:hypothetical protein